MFVEEQVRLSALRRCVFVAGRLGEWEAYDGRTLLQVVASAGRPADGRPPERRSVATIMAARASQASQASRGGIALIYFCGAWAYEYSRRRTDGKICSVSVSVSVAV